ncbi:MAG: rod shape-determining protein MreC [bacterium]
MINFCLRHKAGTLLVLLLLIAVFLMSHYSWQRTKIEKRIGSIFVPFQSLMSSTLRFPGDVWGRLSELNRLKEENIRLKAELGQLIKEKEQWQRARLENKRLRNLLGYKKRLPYSTTAARIIGYDPTNWFSTIVLNRGQQDGIKETRAVVTYQDGQEGLVGRVISTREDSSQVLLLLDQNLAVGAKVVRTQAKGLVEGRNKRTCRMRYLPSDTDLTPGDMIVTSGEGGIFPEGIPLGKVIGFKREAQRLFLEAELQPLIDFNRLEDVLVINYQGNYSATD